MSRFHNAFVIFAAMAAGSLAAQTTRPYFMAAGAIQAMPAQEPLYRNGDVVSGFSSVASEADVITVFPEYLGIPFDEFSKSSIMPATHPWAVKMTELANSVKSTGKPILLQLVLSRDRMAPKAIVSNGQSVLDKTWVTNCYDFVPQFSSMRGAFLNYTSYLVKLFAPKYVVMMVEVNLYWVHCGGTTNSWRKLIDIQRDAYTIAKRIDPQLVVFPSFKLEDIYGQTTTGFDSAQWSAMSLLKRDRIGLASYPYALRRSNGSFISPYDLPLDYFTRIRDRNPDEPPIAITETGWNSTGLTFGDTSTCYNDYIYSSESFAVAYMNLLFYTAVNKGLSGITWWSHEDLITTTAMGSCYPVATGPEFTACNGEVWCKGINGMKNEMTGWTPLFAELVFKVFGTMGLRTYEGMPRPQLMAAWMAQFNTPWSGQ